jgi:endonuclease G
MDPRMQLVVVALLVIAGIIFAAAYLDSTRPGGWSSSPVSVQMLLGNPSGVTTDSSNRDNYLMVKPYYALSYNSAKGIPNWVSWQVTSADLGDAPRKQVFDPDTALPDGFSVITQRDYNGSGFDRGHMCPHSDRAANQEMSFATFVMSNIIPQAPNVNRKAWEQLESYCRELVSQEHDHLYIVSGPAGQGGRGSRGSAQSLAGGKVTVPAECWKIVVVEPDDGGDDMANISQATRVITVIMPNDQDQVGEEWAGFRTSPAAVERETGLHFFDRVRPDVAGVLRQKVDDRPIPRPRPRRYGGE